MVSARWSQLWSAVFPLQRRRFWADSSEAAFAAAFFGAAFCFGAGFGVIRCTDLDLGARRLHIRLREGQRLQGFRRRCTFPAS